MPIKKLVALIPPPATPLDNEGNWRAAEIVVGVQYPLDFRDLIARYGSGAFFQGHLTVYNPLTVEGLACIKQSETFCRQYQQGPFPLSLSVHPDRPGLLPWGGDENGNTYCWLTTGKPDKWPIVYLAHGDESHPIQVQTGITGFLTGYAIDEFEALIQPGDTLTEAMLVFTPGRSQAEIARELLRGRKGK